jgi:hypothetical protein
MEIFNYSNNSTNPYKVEARHQLIPTCLICRKGSVIIFDGSDYFSHFMRGAYIQDAFPYLPSSQREHILTGMHPKCQDEIYNSLEDL